MILWTIQPFSLYEKLLAQDILHCDPASEGFDTDFKDGYDWIAEQMKLRVGPPPEGVQYPFWAWALIDGLSKKPDLRRTDFRNYAGENVVLELEIPDADVLLSDFDNWHCVLNRMYLHKINDEEDKREENDVWFCNLPDDARNSIILKSWEKIFDKDDPDNSWDYVQAVFWELRIDQVKSVRRFMGKKAIQKPKCQ